MKKQIALLLTAMIVVVGGVAGMSAYEAHIINVTAHIENALEVSPASGKIVFGTVFPQEYFEKTLTITTSDSFCAADQTRVLNIDYKIVQKPKCWNNDPLNPQYAPVDYATHECPKIGDVQYVEMASLCPYLSKTPQQIDPEPYTDYGVLAFHDPEDEDSIARGTINKYYDLVDYWTIDFPVPCFKGYCAQDWPAFVKSHNPDADPKAFELVGDPNGTDLGCDLWVEVTKIY